MMMACVETEATSRGRQVLTRETCEQNSVSEFFELKLDKAASKVSLAPLVQRRPKR